jgi:hypothetical protein
VGYIKLCVYGHKKQQFLVHEKIYWTHFTKRNKNKVIDTFVEGLKGGAVQCGKVSRFHFQPNLLQGKQHESFI